jgi:hypothetical protein
MNFSSESVTPFLLAVFILLLFYTILLIITPYCSWYNGKINSITYGTKKALIQGSDENRRVNKEAYDAVRKIDMKKVGNSISSFVSGIKDSVVSFYNKF